MLNIVTLNLIGWMLLLTYCSHVPANICSNAAAARTADWRLLLTKALSGSSEGGRIYTIKWLGILARIGAPSFAQYGVELLVEQLKDESLQVVRTQWFYLFNTI